MSSICMSYNHIKHTHERKQKEPVQHMSLRIEQETCAKTFKKKSKDAVMRWQLYFSLRQHNTHGDFALAAPRSLLISLAGFIHAHPVLCIPPASLQPQCIMAPSVRSHFEHPGSCKDSPRMPLLFSKKIICLQKPVYFKYGEGAMRKKKQAGTLMKQN